MVMIKYSQEYLQKDFSILFVIVKTFKLWNFILENILPL